MAALSVGMGAEQGIGAVAVATVMCAMIGTLNAMTWAVLFSRPRMMAGYRRVRRWVDGVVAGLFAAAGFGLIRSALAR